MSIVFYKSHIDTIGELQAVAKKHGGSIIIGADSNVIADDFYVDEEIKDSDETIRRIVDKGYDIISGSSDTFKIVFELYVKGSVNILTYEIIKGYVEIDPEDYEDDEELYFEYSDSHYYFDFTKTRVVGFEGVKYTPNVYRTGIALREFSYLVCDFLGEPRIEKHY